MTKRVYYIRASSILFDSRATKEIGTLLKSGFEVIVIGWNRDGINAEAECRTLFGGGDKIEFRFLNQTMKTIIGFRDISSVLKWFSFVRKNIQKSDGCIAVHACDLICGIPARKKAKKCRIPLVYDIFDYYVDTHMPKQPLRWFIERQELKVINRAAVTIICTEERRTQLRKAHPKKVVVIFNAPDIPVLPSALPTYDYCYFGAMGETRLTWEILSGYRDHPNIKMCFGGFGEKRCVQLAKELAENYENFRYLGQIPYSKVLEEESKTKILSAIYNPENINNRLCAPNKFYEALGLGKPLIVCKGTSIESTVVGHGLGKSINYSGKEFYEALISMLDDQDLMNRAKKTARELYEKEYSWSLMEERIADLYSFLG